MYGNQKGRLRSSSSFNDELSLISGSTDYQRNRRDRLQKYEEVLRPATGPAPLTCPCAP